MFNLIERAMAAGSSTVQAITPVSNVNLSIPQFVAQILTWLLYFGGALAVIYLMYGGFLYITSAGDEDKAKTGRTAVVNAIIGVIIIALALVIVQWGMDVAGGSAK